MRKIIPCLMALLLTGSLFAQYKKSSVFSREGRTYGLGTHFYAFRDGKSTPIGYKISFGSDREGKRFFYETDLQIIPSFNYTYMTFDSESGDDIKVAGTARTSIIYGFNYNFHLINNEGDEGRIRPYVSAGLSFAVLHGVKHEVSTSSTYYQKRQTVDGGSTGGIGAGLGVLLNFTPTIGIDVRGGYMFQYHLQRILDPGVDPYHLIDNHPYVSAGLRLRFAAKE